MTMTEERPAEMVADAPAWQVTIKASELVDALKGVSLFACTDDTLPILVGVKMSLAGDELTLCATDRYTLAVQTIKLEAGAGDGSLVMPAATVKQLTALKVQPVDYQVIVVTVAQDGTYTIRYPDTRTANAYTVSYPANEGNFPEHCVKMLAEFTPAEAGRAAPSVAFNPAFIARFAKIPGDKHQAVTFTQGASSDKPVRFECGQVTGLIVPIRQSQ